jgi:hypothetical protein
MEQICPLLTLGSKCQRSSTLDIAVEIRVRALKCYLFHLKSPYHTYGLLKGGCSQLTLGSKGQRSRALDIEVATRFLGSRTLPFPLRITISHLWTIHGTNKISIKFEVSRLKAKCIGLYPLRKEVIYTYQPLQEFGVSEW